MADGLALIGVQVELIKGLLDKVAGADDGLFQYSELLAELELFDVRERARRSSGDSNH